MTGFETLSGECLCGKVSWDMHGPFDFFAMCQCSLCRKLTGSAFTTNLFVKADQFRWISGENNRFEFQMPKPSNFITASCKTCGSRVPKIFGRNNHKVLIPYGSTKKKPEIPTSFICYNDHTEWFTDLKNALDSE